MTEVGHPFLFYFPLQTVLIDDDNKFLEIAKTNLSMFKIHDFESSNQALSGISPIEVKLKNFVEQQLSEVFHLNYNNIKNFVEVYKDKHGIIIADFDMSANENNMDGISLLLKFQTTNVIRVLLTNVYTIDKAVEALNKGIINYYLAKDKIESISEVVSGLQMKFFYSITNDILSMLEKHGLEFLGDMDYIQIFNKIVKSYQINKYYILNSYGAYYLENDTEKFILTIFSKSDLDDIALEPSMPNKDSLLSGKQIPSYFSETECKLIDAQNYGKYYYAIEKYQKED